MSMQMSLKVGNRVKWYVHSRSLLFHIPHTHRHIWCAQCVLRSRYEDMLKCVMSYGKTLAVINWNEKKLWKSEQTHTHTLNKWTSMVLSFYLLRVMHFPSLKSLWKKKRGQHFYFDDIIPSSALILSFSMTFCHLQTKLNGSAVMVCGAFQHRYTTRLNIEKMKE